MCYAAVALVTDMDAGVESGEGVGQAGGVRDVRAQHRPAQAAARRRRGPDLPEPGAGCGCASWADGIELPYELAVKVLLPGSAGFIGGAVADQLEARGDEVVRVDLLIPEAHAAGRPTAEGPTASTSATRLRCVPCSTASTWSATSRRWSAPVSRSPTCRRTPPTTTWAPRSCSRRCTRPECTGWWLPRRWWSTARAATSAPSTATRRRGRAVARRSTAVTSRTTAPAAAGRSAWAPVDEDARLDPRSSYAASKVATEHYLAAWVRQAPGAAVALRYHNVYGPRMPRDTPYSGVAAMFRSALEQGRAPDVFEDGGQMRDFVHVHDVARANLLAIAAGGRGDPRVVRDLQRRSGRARPDQAGRGAGRRRAPGPRPDAARQRPLPARRRAARRRVRRTRPATSSASAPGVAGPRPAGVRDRAAAVGSPGPLGNWRLP